MDAGAGDFGLGEAAGAGVLTQGTRTSWAFAFEATESILLGDGEVPVASGMTRFESSSCSTAQT